MEACEEDGAQTYLMVCMGYFEDHQEGLEGFSLVYKLQGR